ncbi:Fic/DOC family protein [Lactococcus insecticola]|uniref:protein adenylyltransferase n=1 Tax=Pseudolactococcus insecticola TaxID=2709158 RepID=A0A6A0B7K5_9LACT|nr:Fic family protein [Lactococcus insecticola]GFH41300.1 Fic family protein [Lactococcus insecticola]
MARKSYEEYKYLDPDNEYTYRDSAVLINKFTITDGDEAYEKEYRLARLRGLDLILTPIKVRKLDDVLKIHGFIFGDMYTWAGQLRKVNISKEGNAFMPLQSFDTGIEYIDSLIADFHNRVNSRQEIAKSLAEILDNLNYMHPFREGNGRTQREVIRSLALEKGYYADIDVATDDEIYNLYMDGTVFGDVAKLTKLFDIILEKTDFWEHR